MAQTVKLISDSTCDLSKELVEKYDITILPLHILLGEDEYRDGVDITPEEIFRWSDENKTASSVLYRRGFTISMYQSQNSSQIKSYTFCTAIPSSK